MTSTESREATTGDQTLVDAVARAICKSYFGDVVTHGDARCCQVGGSDGCCVIALWPAAEAAIAAMRGK